MMGEQPDALTRRQLLEMREYPAEVIAGGNGRVNAEGHLVEVGVTTCSECERPARPKSPTFSPAHSKRRRTRLRKAGRSDDLAPMGARSPVEIRDKGSVAALPEMRTTVHIPQSEEDAPLDWTIVVSRLCAARLEISEVRLAGGWLLTRG